MSTEVREMLLLYDGVCGFCNAITQFVLPRDKHNRFRFATLQSDHAKAILARHNRPIEDLDTFYIVLDAGLPTERLMSRARAGLLVARGLGAPWSFARIFGVLPTFVLDAGYDLIARNRYRIFGRLEACTIPRPEWRHKFIA